MSKTLPELAIFGAQPVFQNIRSTSNLVQPDRDRFFFYAKQSYDAGWLTNNGPMVRLLEERLARLHGAEFCISTCNGLWALVLCIKCLALEGKHEILMPSLTYRRMADIAAWLQMTPYYCDVEPFSLGICPRAVKRQINEGTGLILAAHPIVNLCDIDALEAISHESDIPLLFDSVEAAYASHKGRMVGSFGKAECFSMHASKFLNGFEAGYITTNDTDLAARLRLMRGFGFSGPNSIIEFGLNAKLNEFHAAMALASLDDLECQVERNREKHGLYRDLLADVPGIDLQEYELSEKRTFKNILVRLTEAWPISRDNTLRILHAENMLARPYYFPPLHDKPAEYPTRTGKMTNSDRLKHEYLLLPSGDFLSHKDIKKVVKHLEYISNISEEVVQSLEAENR